MEYKEIKSDAKGIYIALDSGEMRTDFDTGLTKATLLYCNGKPEDKNTLHEVNLEISMEFIDDTYNLTGGATKDEKVMACLDVGERAYEEKRGIPKGFDWIVGLKSNSPLRYIPRIDMKSTSHK